MLSKAERVRRVHVLNERLFYLANRPSPYGDWAHKTMWNVTLVVQQIRFKSAWSLHRLIRRWCLRSSKKTAHYLVVVSAKNCGPRDWVCRSKILTAHQRKATAQQKVAQRAIPTVKLLLAVASTSFDGWPRFVCKAPLQNIGCNLDVVELFVLAKASPEDNILVMHHTTSTGCSIWLCRGKDTVCCVGARGYHRSLKH